MTDILTLIGSVGGIATLIGAEAGVGQHEHYYSGP